MAFQKISCLSCLVILSIDVYTRFFDFSSERQLYRKYILIKVSRKSLAGLAIFGREIGAIQIFLVVFDYSTNKVWSFILPGLS